MAKILIVDDDTKTAEHLCGYLRGAGHACWAVGDGLKTIEKARAEHVDLIVLDIMLPGSVSGFEVCRRVRADSELYMLPVLILSAMAEEEEIQHGLSQGADDYVTKPFDAPHLLQRIESLLRANADVEMLDEMTSLPSANVTKREIQRRISCQETFVLACAELMHLREFGRYFGDDARKKAIRHLARALAIGGQAFSAADLMAGHMGGGYFVCLASPDIAESYCDRVMKAWQTHLPSFQGGIALSQGTQDSAGDKPPPPSLDLLMCVTARNRRDTSSSQDLFEVVMRLRNSALADNAPGIHFNRRA